jgi:choline kinase/thiamine kinase-like enzyme
LTTPLSVLILAAGHGSRMGRFSSLINKSLIPYDNKPLLSHIIESFPPNTHFFIACGHLGNQIKDYVTLVHSEKQITCIDIPNFDDKTTGPGTSIRHCAPQLPNQFMWITCDTLFKFNYNQLLDHTWIGIAPVESTLSKDYCWVTTNKDTIITVNNKSHSDNTVDAFIGLMYVHDKDEYINILTKNNYKEAVDGFPPNTKAYQVDEWNDFGIFHKWKSLNDQTVELSLPKPNELFYIDNGTVVKFATDSTISEKRKLRVMLNQACMPTNVKSKNNFFSHDYVNGDPFYSHLTIPRFIQLLDTLQHTVWNKKPACSSTTLISAAYDFYVTKTFRRLADFRKSHSWKERAMVNGSEVKTIDEYLEQIDFNWLVSESKFTTIHGDLQFDNLIYNPDTNQFTFIDWRPDFSGNPYGDIYYDFSKMLGGLLLNYAKIRNKELVYHETETRAMINDLSIPDVNSYIQILKEFVENNGYSWKKVTLLVPIIYVNMSPLHESPMDKYLISFAQLLFELYC